MKEKFKIIITDFLERKLPEKIIDRTIEIPLNSKKIISLIGARRTGKTYLFYSLIRKLRKKQDKGRIVYSNFEDDRFFPLKLSDFDLFIEAYYELFPDNRRKRVYLLPNQLLF